MKLLADKDERFRGLFVKVSILVLIALVGLTLNLVISVIKKGFFTPKSAIYFVADSGQDIKVGTPVKLSGFKIGSVSKLDLDNKAQAQVEIMIENRYLALLKEDAVVSMKKEGVIGDSILEAKRGSEGKPPLKALGTISFERGGGLEQIANDLRDRLYPALDEINMLLKDANDPKGDVRKTLGNLRKFTDEMNATHARINQMLKEDVRPALTSARKSAEGTEAIIVKLNQTLPAMIDKTDVSLENIRQTTESLKSTIDHSAPQLSGFIGETRGLVSDTRTIMDSASTSWPLKNMMSPPEQGLVKMDSHD